MKKILLFFTISLTAFISCNNSSTDKQKELALKEKELALKEQELKLKEKENITQDTSPTQVSTIDSTQIQTDESSNVENLIGYWFIPHGATINIQFNRDGRFIFNDYNMTLEKDETLQGSYQLEKGTLTLLYDDRPKQKFRFYKGEKGDKNYYIKKSGYYFVKGVNGYDK